VVVTSTPLIFSVGIRPIPRVTYRTAIRHLGTLAIGRTFACRVRVAKLPNRRVA
jgi:hypothetical protein